MRREPNACRDSAVAHVLLVCALLYVADAGDDHLAGFRIGRAPSLADVADHGRPRAGWSVGAREPVLIDAGENATSFFMAMNGTAEAARGPVGVHCDFDVVSPTVNAEMRHAGVVTAAPSELRVDYNCHRAGIGLLAVSVPLPGHTTVMLRWSKRCSALPMTGISIGTSTSTLTDVVLEGAVAPAYNASTVRAAMGTLTRRAVFVVTASLLGGSQRLGPVSALVEPPVALASVHGPLAAGLTLRPGEREELVVHVQCIAAGQGVVQITLPPAHPFDPHAPLRFAWRHQCGGAPSPGFIVSTNPVHAGVSVADADVAEGGVSTAGWAARRYVADSHEHITLLHYAMDPRARPDGSTEPLVQLMGLPAVTLDADPDVAVARVVGPDGVGLQVAPLPAVETEWRQLGVRFLCTTRQRVEIEVNVTLPVGVFDPVTISFTKVCGGPKAGMHVTVAASALDGHEDDDTSRVVVVRDGRPSRGWHADTHTAVVPDGQEVTEFACRMGAQRTPSEDARAPNASRLEEQAESRHQVVQSATVTPVDPEDDWLSLSVNGSLAAGGKLDVSRMQSLVVEYRCPTLRWFPTLAPMAFVGRSAAVRAAIDMPNFETVEFVWTKHCTGWVWTPIGFPVFVLLLALVAGAAFLAWRIVQAKLGKRGYQQVPTDEP